MKNLKLIATSLFILSLSFMSNADDAVYDNVEKLLSYEVEPVDFAKTTFNKNIIKVSSCDKFGWCKVKGRELYFKRHQFKKINKNTYKRVKNVSLKTQPSFYIKDKNSKFGYKKLDIAKSFFTPDRKQVNISNLINPMDSLEISYCTSVWCKLPSKNLFIKKKDMTKINSHCYRKNNNGVSSNLYSLVKGSYKKVNRDINKQDLLCLSSVKAVKKPIKTNVNVIENTTPVIVNKVDIAVKKPSNKEVKKETKKEARKEVRKETREVPYDREGLFVFGGLGTSSFNVVKSSDATLTSGSLSQNGLAFDFGVGYENNKYLLTINYQRSPLDNISFNYLYATANYKIVNERLFTPYVGVALGYGWGNWDKAPVSIVRDGDEKVNRSPVYGIQMGVVSKLTKRFGIYVEVKHLRDAFSTRISNQTAIRHEYQNTLVGGIRYDF